MILLHFGIQLASMYHHQPEFTCAAKAHETPCFTDVEHDAVKQAECTHLT